MFKRVNLTILGSVLLQSTSLIHPCSSGPTFPNIHGFNEELSKYVRMAPEPPAEPTKHQQQLFNHNKPHERPLETPHVGDKRRHSEPDNSSPLFHTSWPHTSSSGHSLQNDLQFPDWDNIQVPDSPKTAGHSNPPSLVTSPKSTKETTTKLRRRKKQAGIQYESEKKNILSILQHEKLVVKPFHICGMRDKNFGWISTLKFWEKSDPTYLHALVHMFMQSYRALHESSRPGVWTLIEILVASGRVSEVDAEQRLSALLFNVCARHTDLLAGLTAVAQNNPSHGMQINVEMQERGNLLEWLLGQVGHVNMEGDPATASGAAGARHQKGERQFSQPQRWLIDYLTCIPDTSELHRPRWRLAQQDTNQPEGSATMEVTLQEAKLTELAIKLLGTFYKLSNPRKWLIIFQKDAHFVNFFVAQRLHWHYHQDTYLSDGSPINRQLHLLPIFPWSKTYKFDHNLPPEDFVLKLLYISEAIFRSASNYVDEKFLNLPN